MQIASLHYNFRFSIILQIGYFSYNKVTDIYVKHANIYK